MERLKSLPFLSTSSILLLTSIALILWYYFQAKFSYWSRRGVPSVNLAKCLFQTIQFTFGQKQFNDMHTAHYAELAGHPYGGAFQWTHPSLVLRDPAVIKEALIKSFQSFHDRSPEPDVKLDQLSGNLFQLTGERWRQVRHKMSPAFSSAKMKVMYETLKECSRELDALLQKLCSETGGTEIDVRDLMDNYTLEVMAVCAMGIRSNAIQDPDCELKRMVRKAFKFDLRRNLHDLLELVHPKLPRWCMLKSVDPEVERFWLAICKEALELRTTKATSQIDFLQILMDRLSPEMKAMCEQAEERPEEFESSEDTEGPIFTENVMASVVSSFFSAGFLPISAALTFCFYELSLQHEIQEKIFKEIQTVKAGDGADISYEDMKKCHYTDQVINETLRKYPVAGLIRRICTEPFTLADSNVIVEKNTRIFITTQSLQLDPKYFPEPSKFDPDRFSEENINKIVPGSYLPFGDGPRFCIANRFVLMDIKKMVLTMVSNYTILPCTRTPKHIKFDETVFTLSPKGGLWLRFQKRG